MINYDFSCRTRINRKHTSISNGYGACTNDARRNVFVQNRYLGLTHEYYQKKKELLAQQGVEWDVSTKNIMEFQK